MGEGERFVPSGFQYGRYPRKRRFGSDPQIVGKLLRLEEKPYTVVGVRPANCRLPERFDVLLPTTLRFQMSNLRFQISFQVRRRASCGLLRAWQQEQRGEGGPIR
jgi:hypothetical protein